MIINRLIVGQQYDHEIDNDSFVNVLFLEDFGPWKRGQEVDYLIVDYEEGTMTECDKQRNPITKVEIKLSV